MEEDKNLEHGMVVNIVLIGLIGIICLIGNVLVIRALIFSKYPRIPIYIAIGGMAFADILNMIMEIPYNIFEQLGLSSLMNTPLCKSHFYLTSVCRYVAGLHLVLFSIIRCIMLNDRVRSRSYVVHTLVACIVIWIVICLTNVLNLKTVMFEERLNSCIELGSTLSEEDERIMWLRFSFSYMIPIFVIIILYILTKVLSMRFYDESYSSRERRFSRMVTCLVLTFAIFKLPHEVVEIMIFYRARHLFELMNILEASDEDHEKLNTLFDISEYTIGVYFIDLALRPIIYAKFSYYFGQSFDEILNCNSCREKKHRPRRRKTDSGMSNHTNLIEEDDREEIKEDQSLESDNELDKNEDISLEENNPPAVEEEKFIKQGKDIDIERESLQNVDYKACPISIFINNKDCDKNIPMFVGSICDEKNGMVSEVCSIL